MIVHAECSPGWADRCASSRGPKCTCRCGGANHGKNNPLPLFAGVPGASSPPSSVSMRAGTLPRHAKFSVVLSTRDVVILKDLGPWSEHLTITNDAENVVASCRDYLSGRRLFYIDSEGAVDELAYESDGVGRLHFRGFVPGYRTIDDAIDALAAKGVDTSPIFSGKVAP